MCGIFGHIGQKEFDPKDMKILALYNEDRGSDAVGVYNHTSKKKLRKRVQKENVNVWRADIMRGELEPTNFLIGHTRSKSTGYNTIDNVHPFVSDNICGVHNGTIVNYEELAEKYDVKVEKGESDSSVLYKILGKTEGDLSVLSDIEGSANLAFTKNDGNLYLYRKDEQRPLFYSAFYMTATGIHHMMFSSIEDSLRAIDVVPKNSIHKVESGKVLTFDKSTKCISEYEVKDNLDKPKKKVQTSSHNKNYGGWDNKSTSSSTKTGGTTNTGVSRREVMLHCLNYMKIAEENIKSCSVFKSEGEEYTLFNIESGASAVIKGNYTHYNPTDYSREKAKNVLDNLYCEAREIFYDLLIFNNGSFIEDRTYHNSKNKGVHEEETDVEKETEEEETEDNKHPYESISDIWGAYQEFIEQQQKLGNISKNLAAQLSEYDETNLNDLNEVLKQMDDTIDTVYNSASDLSENIVDKIKNEEQ